MSQSDDTHAARSRNRMGSKPQGLGVSACGFCLFVVYLFFSSEDVHGRAVY